jgi:hypothetical protein
MELLDAPDNMVGAALLNTVRLAGRNIQKGFRSRSDISGADKALLYVSATVMPVLVMRVGWLGLAPKTATGEVYVGAIPDHVPEPIEAAS